MRAAAARSALRPAPPRLCLLGLLLVGSALAAAGCAGSMRQARPPETGAALIRAMHDRYADRWYRTLTFVQRTIFHRPDGTTREETWYEALALPGRFRIDIAPLEDGNLRLFAHDSVYVYQGGALVRRQPGVHALVVLGFDVYGQPPERTVEALAGLGFDLSVLHEATWQGRPVYVVGAGPGDLRSPQFWVDRERLVFVRLLEPVGPEKASVQDVRFDAYRPLAGGWIAPEVQVFVDGRLVMTEHYRDVRAGVALDERLFDPAHAPHVRWW